MASLRDRVWTRGLRKGTVQSLLLSLPVLFAAILYSFLLFTAWWDYGSHRFLGWDTLVYVLSAQQTRIQGLIWLYEYWGHANVYVLLLAGIQALPGQEVLLAHAIPVALVTLLSLGVGILTGRMAGPSVGLLAALLTATSFATFRLFVDLHRALLAFVIVTFLIAYDSPKSLTTIRLGRRGVLTLLLLLAMSFAEFEIYLALVAATGLGILWRVPRRTRNVLPLLWSLAPGVLFAFTPTGFETFQKILSGRPALLVAELPPDLALLYLSTVVSLPFAAFGLTGLLRRAFSDRQGPAVFFVSWVITMVTVFILFGLLLGSISTFRALLLLHVPVLTAIGAHILVTRLSAKMRQSRARLPDNRFMRVALDENTGRVAFALLGASLVLLTGTQLVVNSERFLKPVVNESLYQRLVDSSEHVSSMGWSPPIYLMMNRTYIQILPPIRLELGILNGLAFVYWGDLNFVAWDVHPQLADPNLGQSVESLFLANQEFQLIQEFIGSDPVRILSHPIVIIQPELFPRSLPAGFDTYRVEEGIFVIPPNALSPQTFLSWEIVASEDAFDLGGASLVEREWSLSSQVVEIYTTDGYQISFPYYFPVSGTYEISVHLFDFPATDLNTTVPLSPLELMIDDATVNTLVYSAQQITWWNTTVAIQAGFDVVTLRAASETSPFRLSLDTVWIAAAP